MSWEFELLVDAYGGVAEGPAWDGSGLLFTQIHKCRIARWDPAKKECSVVREDTDYANGLMLDSEGKLYACGGGSRSVVRFEPDGSTTTLIDNYEGKRNSFYAGDTISAGRTTFNVGLRYDNQSASLLG